MRSASRIRIPILILLAWLTASVGRAQDQNPVLAALPDGQWSELPESAMTSAGPMAIECCDFSIGCELPGIFSFSGATR